MALIQWKQIDTELSSSVYTGSFNISGSIVLNGVDLTLFEGSKWTGSFDGSISRESDVTITGSLLLDFDGIENYFSVKVSGEEKIKINNQGVLQFISQSAPPDPIPGGIYYDESNEFYLGFKV
jgi:hypothetical protein